MSGSGIRGVLPVLAALLVAVFGSGGVLGWLGKRFAERSSASAQLSKTLLDASREWVEQAQEERAQLTARISEQDALLAALRLECFEKEGEIRQLKQVNRSLQAAIDRAERDG
jgi:hypothetical protein